MKKLMMMVVCLSLAWCSFAQTRSLPDERWIGESQEQESDKTLSPYFFIPSGDSAVDSFPLLETKAQVNITGVIANVEITQVYKNNGATTIEAIYVFPMSTKAAVHKMSMQIGSRTIEARIKERNDARAIYNQAKTNGQTASLLEQERPNVFTMNVANVVPNDKVTVTMHYTELLVPRNGVYEFVHPTVVGPRYGGKLNQAQQENDQWVVNPYLHEGVKSSYVFDINAILNAGMPIEKIFVPSHKVDVQYSGKDKAVITLTSDAQDSGNRDFVLRYSLSGNTIQSGLLLYPGKDENFFLLMAQPPEASKIKALPAREYIFIVDVSGSMHGFPLDVSKSLIKNIIEGLGTRDYFNIVFFSGGNQALSEHSIPASHENKVRAISMLNSQAGGGGTEILPALQRVFNLEKTEGTSRTIVIATDGFVRVEKEAFDLIKENLGRANMFTFGIGTSVNRYIIEGMARVGNGDSFVAMNEAEARKLGEKFYDYISKPILTDISVTAQGLEIYDVEPKHVPDLFARRPIIVYGKYKNANGSITLRGITNSGRYEKVYTLTAQDQDDGNSALRLLWARNKIAELADYAKVGSNVKEEVTRLGLEYSLMTEFTSFVAVDTLKRAGDESVSVVQPLPLPQNVSNYAVGAPAQAGATCDFSGTSYMMNGGGANYMVSDSLSGFANFKLATQARRKASVGGVNEQYSPGKTEQEGIMKKDVKACLDKETKEEVRFIIHKLPVGLSKEVLFSAIGPIKKDLAIILKNEKSRLMKVSISVKNGRCVSIKSKSVVLLDEKVSKSIEALMKGINFPAYVNGMLAFTISL